MEKFVKAEKTRSGLFGLWEQGGSVSKSEASSVIIARKDGSKPRAIFSKNEENGRHALVVLQKGFFVVEVVRNDMELDVDLFRVDGISHNGDVKLVRKNYRWHGQWENFVHPKFKPAIEAALKKAKIRNCKEMIYAIPLR